MNAFDSFTELLDYPVYVVTAASEGRRAGCLVGFAGQCSITPPRFVVWLSKANRTYRVAAASDLLAVHLLPRRHELAELFGGHSGDRTDKFASVAWTPGPGGVPILTDAPAWFTGRVHARTDGGDHVGFLLDPQSAGRRPGAHEPTDVLSYQDVADIQAGHPAGEGSGR
ncbi:flavin reductase family protein [Streptomyces sp. NRRL WC-3742]|uniref:flavin reductase family protein n=1 Tax=Streptomyces sp. NRRL WC-3742 TaxID=1463934 RepID=UPI00056929E3|nr:flavin reductase family protein [Streptomyces sp. NRRL WC-3742]